MAAGFAHLLELSNKIELSRDACLTVQQIGSAAAAPRGVYAHSRAMCIAFSLVVVFTFTYAAFLAVSFLVISLLTRRHA